MSQPDSRLLDVIVKRVTRVVQPLRIVLFGSAVRSGIGPHSDLDIVVGIPDGTHRREASGTISRALRLGVPKDIVVVTEHDVRQNGDNHWLVMKPAWEEGKELYRATG